MSLKGYLKLLLVTQLLLYSSCTDNINLQQYNNYKRNDVEGYWKADIKNENIIFRINRISNNNYDGKVYTFKGNSIISVLNLDDIKYESNRLKMITNTKMNVRFNGELDTSSQTINGFLNVSNRNESTFKLIRFKGVECHLIDQYMSKNNSLIYKTIDKLPFIKNNYKNELNTSLNYEINAEANLKEEDQIAVINKWSGDVFGYGEFRTKAVLLAYLIDPFTKSIAKSIFENIKQINSPKGKIRRINEWTSENLTYTQIEKTFTKFPGKDPWGVKENSKTPTQKKLLPSEMNAMKLHTGKISGKCFSLVNFITSVFIHLGVNPNNILIFNSIIEGDRHAMALLKYEGKLIIVNLMMVGLVDDILKGNFKDYTIIGVYNHNFYLNKNFIVSQDDLEKINKIKPNELLVPFFLSLFNFKDNYDIKNNFPSMDREKIYQSVFLENESNYYYNLTKYAYQSLLVSNKKLYLKASLMGPHGKSLANELKTPKEIFKWISNHIRYGSIFQDDEERIMIADQVLVFQQGSHKDKGVLAYTLLRHNGYNPKINISMTNCFIEFNHQIYDIKNETFLKTHPKNIDLEIM